MEEPFSFPKYEDDEPRDINVLQSLAVITVVTVCIGFSVWMLAYQIASAVSE